MASREPKLATYRELLALPPDVHAEVLAGEIVTEPTPLPRHSKVQGAASRFVGGRSTTTMAAADPEDGGPSWRSTWRSAP